MSDDEPIPSLAEALTEIRRLRDVVRELEAASDAWQARVMQLEASAAITFGTLEQPTPDWPTTIEHNIPPNAPPHGEQPPIGHTIKWPSSIGKDDE